MKASDVIGRAGSYQTPPKTLSEKTALSPSSIASLHADEEDSSAEFKKDGKMPVFVYKVVRHLDIPGFDFEHAEKMTVLGIFDNKEKAINAAFEQYEVLAAFAEPTSSLMTKSSDPVLGLAMFQTRRGKRKEVKIEVQREELKP